MTSFPKKYTKKDLQHLVQAYVEQHPSTSQLFSGFFLPSIQALHLGHFYGLYAKDFLLKQKALYEGKQVQHCLLFQMKPLLSVSDAAQFFAKKRQPLAQLPVMKLRSYLASRREKGIQATTKRLASAFVPYESSREDDSAFAFFLQNVLCSAWEAGKLKRRKSIAYWSVDLQTTIPYHQIDFEKVKVTNYMIKYFVAGKSDTVEISATVPDSIFGDVALLVHPKDKRYQKLVGKRVLIPMVHKSIPVIGDESVDISKHNGIKRVNPTSDFESIALAEKYKLPLDQYVFDAAGNYTEHVGEFKGKSRKEYFANILVFLEDIYGLGKSYEIEVETPYCSYSRELLFPLLVDEWVLDVEIEKALLQQEFQEHPLWSSVKDQLLTHLSAFSGVVSRQLPWGVALPFIKVGEEYLIMPRFETLCQRPDTDLMQSCFDYILWVLVRERYLSSSFAYEKLFGVCSQHLSEIRTAFSLLSLSDKKKEKAVTAFLALLESLTEGDKQMQVFETLIQQSSFLHMEGTSCRVVWSDKSAVHLLYEVVDADVVSAFYRIFLGQSGVVWDTVAVMEEHQLSLFVHELLFQQFVGCRCVYTDIQLLPTLLDKKGERFSYQTLQTTQFSTLLEQYGVSPVRLSLLLHTSLDTDMIFLYDRFLRQIRNGARYCFGPAQPTLSEKQLHTLFVKEADEADFWIMESFLELWNACRTQLSFSLIQDFVQKRFLGYYVELKKLTGGGTLFATSRQIFSGLLTLLYPFVPAYAMALAQVLGLSLGMFVPPSLRKKSTAEVAWVYALFEQILLFKLSLNIKKHQKIAFFLKADTYSLERFGQHQEVFKTLLNIQELTFLRLHEAELAGYQQDMYQSMVIGVKLLKTENKKKVSLADLESQYAQQLEYVKYLRTLVADLSSSVGESEQLTKKKQELDEVKGRIDTLSLQLQKMKMKRGA